MPGMTCISPRALADDRISGVNVDSCAISADTRYGSRFLAVRPFDQIPVVERKMIRSTSVGSVSPSAERNCGYARRMVVMDPRSAAKRSSARSSFACWARIHAGVAWSAGESPHVRCACCTLLQSVIEQSRRHEGAHERLCRAHCSSQVVTARAGVGAAAPPRPGASLIRRDAETAVVRVAVVDRGQAVTREGACGVAHAIARALTNGSGPAGNPLAGTRPPRIRRPVPSQRTSGFDTRPTRFPRGALGHADGAENDRAVRERPRRPCHPDRRRRSRTPGHRGVSAAHGEAG